MFAVHSFVLLVALLAWTICALDQFEGNKRFSVEQEAIIRSIPWNPETAIYNDYLRYGSPIHAFMSSEIELSRRADPDKTTVEALPASLEKIYVTRVKVGKQTFIISFDTGSADFWVTSTHLPTSQRGDRPASRIYDPKANGAIELTGHTWKELYGDRSFVSGKIYLDKVTIGNLTVPNQAVGATQSISAMYIQDNSRDGMLGLGFISKSRVKPKAQLTWFEMIRPKLAAPVFTAHLKRRRAGTYDFGFIDKKKYTGNITWVDVRKPLGWWEFPVTGFAIAGAPVQTINITAVADTGASLFHLPRAVADAYWAKVQGATFVTRYNGWTFPCKNTTPDMSVVIGGKRITVPGLAMNYQSIPGSSNCFGGIQRDLGVPFSLFGDVFMKGQLVIFEYPANGWARLGFAKSSTRV